MTMFAELDDPTVEALLGGEPTGDDGLGPLEDLVRSLRAAAAAEPLPAMSAPLRARLDAPTVLRLDARPGRRRSARTAVAAAAAVAVLSLTGAAAAQNRLPAQLQDAVSSTAELVGVDIPSSEDRGEHGTPDPEGYQGDTTPGGATPAEPNGSGEPATPATPPEPPAGQGPPATLPDEANGTRPDDPGSQGGQPDDPGSQGGQPDDPGSQGDDAGPDAPDDPEDATDGTADEAAAAGKSAKAASGPLGEDG